MPLLDAEADRFAVQDVTNALKPGRTPGCGSYERSLHNG